jgi:TRAP-type C4-dicarboxylate transport system substrate-binding protein
MKRQSGVVLVVLITLVVVLSVVVQNASAQKSADKAVKLRFASFFPENHMMSYIQRIWQEEITKRTKGLITFENFWGASLGAPLAHIELLRKGTAQVGCIHEWYTPSKFVFGNYEYVFPFGPTNYEIVAKANRKIRSEFPQFAEDGRRENVIMLMDAPGGEYGFMSRKPLRSLDDFKGEKVTLVGRYFGRWLPPGATAVVRPVAERYDLLRTGVVNIDLLPFEHFDAYKIYEVTKYYINAKFITALYGPVYMNIDTFKGFSPEVQKILLETGQEMELRAAREIIPKWWNTLTEKYKKAGITFIDFPDEEIKKWSSSLEDIPAEWAAEVEAKGYPGWKLVQRWQEITTELGFKWVRKWGAKK